MSTASVEIDTMIDMLDNQRKCSRETQRPKSPASSLMKNQKPNSINTTAWDPIVSKPNLKNENERRLPYSRQRQIQQPAPLKFIDLGHSRSKSLPQVEKDECSSSSSVTKEQFNLEIVNNPTKSISHSLPPSPPSKPSYGNNKYLQPNISQQQSCISSTFGLADLPAPPPPSHSPEHDDRIRALIEKQQNTQPPTPISKDLSSKGGGVGGGERSESDIVQRQTASSVESYPTISPSSMLNVTGIFTAPIETNQQKREKRKSSIFTTNKRPHSSCGFPKEVGSMEQLLLQQQQQNGNRRKRADSAATSSRYSSNSASVLGGGVEKSTSSSSSSPNQSWLKRQMEKVKNRSPSSKDYGGNRIQEEESPSIEQQKEKNLLTIARPQSLMEDQIVFSAMGFSDTNSFSSPHSRLQSANSEPNAGFQSRILRSSQNENESKEISVKLKKLFNSSSNRLFSKRSSDATLALEQGQPARRRSRSLGLGVGMKSNRDSVLLKTHKENDFNSTTDSTFCKSILQDDDDLSIIQGGHKGKMRDLKYRRKSKINENYEGQRNSNRFIDQSALLGLYTGKDIKQAEKMAATLAAFASEPNLSPNKNYNQFLSATQEEPISAVSSRIPISPQSSKSSGNNNQAFNLPSWSKWRKDHVRQRQSDMIAEKLVAEAESEIQKEEGGQQQQQQDFSHSAESASWSFRHDSREYFGKLRKHVKSKRSFEDSIKPFPTLEKEQIDRKEKQQALFYSLDVGNLKQDIIPSSAHDSIEEINSQNDHSAPVPPSPNRHSLPPIPPSHSPPNQQQQQHQFNERQNAPSPFRNLLLNRIRNESVERLHQLYKAGNAEEQEQGTSHGNEIY